MRELYYIAIEGVTGVGKFSFAKLLASKLEARACPARVILEKPEGNPFLTDFYRDPQRFAFQTQVFFLLSRYRQQLDLWQRDLFHKVTIVNYLFAKDRIYASLNLENRELALYQKIASSLEKDIPRPDVVIYLQSNTQSLMERIKNRGRPYEKGISVDYIRSLVEAYNRFFFDYKETPLLVVESSHLECLRKEENLDDLVTQLTMPLGGTKYFIPK